MNVSVNPSTTKTSNYFDEMPQPFYSIPYPKKDNEDYWEKIAKDLSQEEKIKTISHKSDNNEIIISVESYNRFSETLVIGRTLRILSRHIPLDFKIFTVVLTDNGIPVTQVSINRHELEEIIDAPNAELLTKK